jgi:multiple sugar transport system substrate-binding protein
LILLLIGSAQANPYAKYAGTTLVVNFPNIAYYNYATNVIPEFTKETGIKVEIDKLEYMKMRDKQLLEMSKPKGDYDLITYVIMWKTEYVAKGLLAPRPISYQSSLADPDYDAQTLSRLRRGDRNGRRPEGIPARSDCLRLRTPLRTETSMFAYRKDIFDKHGWKVPKTYDELLKLCKLVKEKEPGMGALTMRGEAGHQVQHAWFNHLTPFGGEVFNDKWEPLFHKGGSIQAIKAMVEIVKTGPPGIPTFAYGSMTDAFLLGNAAMYLDNTALPGQVRDPNKSKIVGKVGYALHPKGVKYSTETGGFGIAIPANSQKKEAAFLLLQWLTSKATDRKITKFGAMPNRLSTLKDPAMQKEYPEFSAVLENLKYANRIGAPDSGVAGNLHVARRDCAARSHHRKKTPEQAMTDAVEP